MDRTILTLLVGLTGIATAAPARAQDAAVPEAPAVLILSGQALRFLALQYRSYPTEFMGCMVGEVRGDTVVIERIAPADVDPSESTATWVVPQQTCEAAGWTSTVGLIHSHPTGERCWYFFPGTAVPTSDGYSFLRSEYPVDAIMCGDRVVWISRGQMQQEVALVASHAPSTGEGRVVSAAP
ncbi:MAG TPA: Mov34/MPN/PAD-1 family protein [Gemmatimonadales bacterium]|nr:Mov34/MPN/PAD-1 family protein [Gemmatimonadales bacterium]